MMWHLQRGGRRDGQGVTARGRTERIDRKKKTEKDDIVLETRNKKGPHDLLEEIRSEIKRH